MTWSLLPHYAGHSFSFTRYVDIATLVRKSLSSGLFYEMIDVIWGVSLIAQHTTSLLLIPNAHGFFLGCSCHFRCLVKRKGFGLDILETHMDWYMNSPLVIRPRLKLALLLLSLCLLSYWWHGLWPCFSPWLSNVWLLYYFTWAENNMLWGLIHWLLMLSFQSLLYPC